MSEAETSATNMYYVPNVGPSIYMSAAAVEWAERIGSKVEKQVFADFDTARTFADRIHSTVEDLKGKVLYDFHDSDAGDAGSGAGDADAGGEDSPPAE